MFPLEWGLFPQSLHRDVVCHPAPAQCTSGRRDLGSCRFLDVTQSTMDVVLGLPTSLTCCQHPSRAQLQWEQDVRERKCTWKSGMGFPVMYSYTKAEKNSVCLFPLPLVLCL